jgi:hypothetical protein
MCLILILAWLIVTTINGWRARAIDRHWEQAWLESLKDD